MLHVIVNPLLNGFSYNDNFWYISTLFVLYLFFPYLNELADAVSRKKRRILCALLPILAWYIYYLNIYYPPGNAFLFFYTNPLFRIPEFFVGVLASDIVFEGIVKIKWWQTIFISVIVGTAIHCLYPFWSTLYNMYDIIVIPYFFVLLLAAGSARDNTAFSKIAKSRCVKYVTSLGLSVYLCQSLAVMALEKNWISIPYNKGIIFIITTIILAVLLHAIVKIPCGKILK